MSLTVKNVHKRFGGIKALDNCSMQIEKGKITAIIGPNGSGKSTLFNVISHIIPKDKGAVVFHEKELTAMHDYEVAREGISRTFQNVRLFKNLTIGEHLRIALSSEDESFFRNLLSPPVISDAQIQEYLDLVKLEKPLDTYVTDLSYGQRKLLDLAIAVAKPHDLLLLDEPVAGVNPKLREVFKKIIRDLHKQGETILLIEHDMNFVMDLAQHVIVMDHGTVIAQGKPKQIQKNPQVLEAYLGG